MTLTDCLNAMLEDNQAWLCFLYVQIPLILVAILRLYRTRICGHHRQLLLLILAYQYKTEMPFALYLHGYSRA
jgi:hypothetical protein